MPHGVRPACYTEGDLTSMWFTGFPVGFCYTKAGAMDRAPLMKVMEKQWTSMEQKIKEEKKVARRKMADSQTSDRLPGRGASEVKGPAEHHGW